LIISSNIFCQLNNIGPVMIAQLLIAGSKGLCPPESTSDPPKKTISLIA